LGFDRAIISAVRERQWVPQWVADERDTAWGEEILQVGRTNPRVLDNRLVESQLLGRRSGIIVGDVQAESRVHHDLVRAARTHSYVAVPLTAGGVVTGFLHADCYYQKRDLDEIDARALSIFAAALNQAIRRNAVTEQLEQTRSGLRHLHRSLPAFDHEHPLVARTRAAGRNESSQPDRQQVPEAFLSLSKRELEVTRLIAEGQTNAAIGSRLFVSEGTVKSHVTNIVRKLNASSRSEVVTMWLTTPLIPRKS
jgi:DNA-binding NarL/FixJ family response regulator